MNSRKFLAVSMLVLLLSCFSSNAFAFDDLKFSVGTKMWNSDYSTYILGTRGNIGIKGGEEMLVIPTFSMKYKDFVLSASYWEDEFFFDRYDSQHIEYVAGPGSTISYFSDDSVFVDMERKEMDVTLGYYVLPKLAVMVGYKKIDMELHYIWVYKEALGVTTTFFAGGEDTFSGPFLGFNYSTSLSDRLFGFSSFAIGVLEEEYSERTTSDSGDADYTSVEAGFAYVPTSFMSVSFSYRYQSIVSSSKGSDRESGKDLIEGAMLGVNLSF